MLLLAGSIPLSAQNKNKIIKGIVKTVAGDPVVGATVIVPGTSIGQLTSTDGSYTISVPQDSKSLEFAYLGYETQTVAIEGRSTINVTLKESATQLEDVVVIGYGTVKKKDLTGSVQSVGGNDLVKSMNTDVTEALNGRVGEIGRAHV